MSAISHMKTKNRTQSMKPTQICHPKKGHWCNNSLRYFPYTNRNTTQQMTSRKTKHKRKKKKTRIFVGGPRFVWAFLQLIIRGSAAAVVVTPEKYMARSSSSFQKKICCASNELKGVYQNLLCLRSLSVYTQR